MEVISALQKMIRRGDEVQAMFWAWELVPRYEQYMWRRMTVIVNEDIGLGSPEIITLVETLRKQFFEFRSLGKNGTCRLILANAIIAMCRSEKSRLADHAQRFISQRFLDSFSGPKSTYPPIPDVALDNHTYTGRGMGRGVEFWLEEGCKLEPKAELEDPYKETAERLWLAGKTDAPEWGKRPIGGKLRLDSKHDGKPQPKDEDGDTEPSSSFQDTLF
jgi:hypothetical protein